MNRAVLIPLAAGLAFAASATAGTTRPVATVKGVVIASLPRQGEVVVAAPNGRTTTLRAPSLPAPGTLVRAAAFKLADGTSATSRLQVTGRTHRAHFAGVLVRTVGSTSFFAAGRSVVAVNTAKRTVSSARTLSSAAPLSPGEAAEVEVTISSGGTLDQTSATPTPSGDANQVQLQVTIAAVTPPTPTTAGSLTLTINGQTLVIPLPAGTALPSTFVANATVGMTIQFKQHGLGVDNGNDDNGEDDDSPTGTTTTGTTTTSTIRTTTTTTTTTATTTAQTQTSGSSRHGDGGHDGNGGGGDD